ncbi:MAG TPA: response regulator, partial [Alphaproteobacteria bacterium]
MSSNTKSAIPAENARVLLIEEHASNVMITRKVLERFGIQNVHIASNGTVGLNMLHQSRPDLILMDCTMPGLDGYDATRLIRMKENESGASAPIPIIGLTANTSDTAKNNCALAGMNGCAHKPIDPVEMHRLLSEYIQLRGYKLPEVEDMQVASDDRIDLRVVAQFARAGREPLEMLVTAYIEESSELLKTLRKAYFEGDALKWAQTIHTLRGA